MIICAGYNSTSLYLYSSPGVRYMFIMIVELSEAKAWSSEVDPSGLEIRVLSGTVWLTQEGDGEDRVLGPEATFVAERGGRVAIQSLTRARVEIDAASRIAAAA